MAEETKESAGGQSPNAYGTVLYSITGESNVGDSRPASMKSEGNWQPRWIMTSVYGETGEKHGSGYSGGK